MDSNCINISFLFKMSIGNSNSGFNEDNISTLKKITLPDGSSLPYISGQAIRRYIRDKFVELGQEISPMQDPRSDEQKINEAKTKNPDFTECDPVAYIDDDLFGYMRAVRGDTRKRTSSVRVASAIGMYPFQNDRDLGTRSSQQTRVRADAGGSMFETEITHNYFCVNVLIELDRVGKFDSLELNGKEGFELEAKNKVERLHALVTSIEHLWGGGKQSRLLTDISPKFIVYTRQTSKRPLFLETLRMKPDQLESVDVKLLRSTFDANESIVQKTYIGYLPAFFVNDKEIKESLESVLPLNECFNRIREDISSVYIG